MLPKTDCTPNRLPEASRFLKLAQVQREDLRRDEMANRNGNADDFVVSIDGNGNAIAAPPYDATANCLSQAHDDGQPVSTSTPPASTRVRSRSTVVFQEAGLSDERNDALWEECANPGAMHPQPQQMKENVRAESEIPLSLDPPTQLIWSFLQKEREQGRCSIDFDMDLAQPNSTGVHVRSRRPLSDHLAERDFSLVPKNSASPGPSSVSTNNGILGQDTESDRYADQQAASNIAGNVNGHVLLEATGERLDGGLPDKTEGPNETLSKQSGNDGSEVKSARSPGDPGKSTALLSKLTKTKTKSRFVEPPPSKIKSARDDKADAKSATPSGRVSKSLPERPEDEDEDPFKDIDLPEKYKHLKCGLMSVLQWAALMMIMAGLVCSLTIRILKVYLIWGMHLWKWVLLVLVVFCGRLLSGWAIHVAVFFIERNFLLRKRVLYFVYGLRKGVQNCLWLGLLLLAWNLMFDPKVDRSTKNSKFLSFITKLFECFLIGAVIWLGKTLLVKVLASSFHVNTYFERIQDSIFHQYVLETLLGPPVIEIQLNSNAGVQPKEEQETTDTPKAKESNDETTHKPKVQVHLSAPLRKSGFIGIGETSQRKGDRKSGEMKQNEALSVEQFHKLNPKNVSAWNMKRLINLVRHPGITTLAHTIDESIMGEEDVEITSETQAKAAAKMIFRNVAKPGFRYIEEEDFLRFMRESDVSKVLPLFEGAKETGKITKKSLKNWVVSVYQERRALSHSLNDTKTAVNELHRLISLTVAIVILVISLLVLEIATTHLLVVVSSQLLLVVFMFGNTCKQVFEAIIFLFIMHPYDVGDRVVIDNVQMIVEEMKILYTVFLRYDNEKIYFPNSVLATKPISNFYRSPDMGDSFDFSIHISTPLEKIAELKKKIASFIESNPTMWYPDKHTIVVKEIEDCNRLRMSLWIQHTMNFQNMGEKWIRRSDLLLEIKNYFEELGIEYRLLPQEVHLCDTTSTWGRDVDLYKR